MLCRSRQPDFLLDIIQRQVKENDGKYLLLAHRIKGSLKFISIFKPNTYLYMYIYSQDKPKSLMEIKILQFREY